MGIIEKDIGEKIRQARVLKKISQEELGKKINLKKQSISLIEKGKRDVTLPEIMIIAKYLDKDLEFFLTMEDSMGDQQYNKSLKIIGEKLFPSEKEIIEQLSEEELMKKIYNSDMDVNIFSKLGSLEKITYLANFIIVDIKNGVSSGLYNVETIKKIFDEFKKISNEYNKKIISEFKEKS